MQDWISRPVKLGEFGPPDFIYGKLVAISCTVERSVASLVMDEKGLITCMGMNPLDEIVDISIPKEAFETEKLIQMIFLFI